ncbi:histidine phosphatase family protein [Glaciihabitans sp. INWT7]|uniref:histidine phosphatase family protein n=1 Tax=Glaciihabitans sp. INWT7 TaxID=2596912 RepID=UPI00351CA325
MVENAAACMGAVFSDAMAAGVETVTLVGHSQTLRILIAIAILAGDAPAHRRLFLDNAAVTSVLWEGETPRLSMLNGSAASRGDVPPAGRALSR